MRLAATGDSAVLSAGQQQAAQGKADADQQDEDRGLGRQGSRDRSQPAAFTGAVGLVGSPVEPTSQPYEQQARNGAPPGSRM